MSLKNLVTGSDDGLSASGVSEAINRHCSFDYPVRTTNARHKKALERILQRLIVRGESSTDELLVYFAEDDIHKPSQGRYGEHSGEQWFDDVAKPNLEALPCVTNDGDKWGFSGVDSSNYDEEHTEPLDDLRDDSLLEAEQTLDDRGATRGSVRYDGVLAFYSELVEQETATTDVLDRVTHRTTVGEVEDTLLKLPGVERETVGPAEPEDIAIETYADVLEAEEQLSGEPTVEWTYSE
ncbi:hypothetical protein [Natronococcus sp. A-GB7]|uniref:hypothetical protein n=1 Tax=Natronococcus sp. A-GB7 TaxID=3037649 RepID=UPI00241EADA7|nr:hypothetical protein [Natronococcus sp. A-GB7]MDG5821847.1 hypothetical protein [Natronococcus sp. A-GB7]